jgi:PleD family two-component response regulator
MPSKSDIHVLAVTRDLFVQSKIIELTKPLGLKAQFARDEEEMEKILVSLRPSLVVLDLSTTDYDAFSCARKVKSLSPSTKLFGFFPHVRTELKTRAETLGFDYSIPNSSFLVSLRRILSKQHSL